MPPAFDSTEGDPWIGRTLGSYRLDALLGAGGMGRVYEGVREGPFRQRVAVKLLGRVYSDEARRRFDVERNILATLQHPRIARLLDGGTADDDTPFLVMDVVDGEPITSYCNRRQLSIEHRLDLFGQVCDVVAAAHRQLVIHRDIKPSNVLVTATGEPYLVDFGIAKLLDETEAEGRERTSTSARALTPSYASPEQLTGGRVTTASDDYSLGVLLFELVTGNLPRDAGRADVGPLPDLADWADPPRASVSVGRLTTAVPDILAADDALVFGCGLSPAALRRRLRGDLDAILQRALRPEPEQRYASAVALAADVRRSLAGEPVLADPRSTTDRVGTFLRRHAMASVATAAAFLAIGGFTALSRYQLAQVRAERAAVEAARTQAEQVTAALLQSFDLASSPRSHAGMIAAREIVDDGARRAAELDENPDLQAALRQALGIAYRRLGMFQESLQMLDLALASRQRRYAAEEPPVLETLLESVGTLAMLNRLEEAERRGRTVLIARQRALGDADPSTAAAEIAVAEPLLLAGRFEEALALAEKALTVHRSARHPDDEGVGTALNLIERVHFNLGRFALAERASREEVEVRRHQRPVDRFGLSVALNNLALVLVPRGLWGEAESLFREALDLKRAAVPEGHGEEAITLHNLAFVVWNRGDPATATRLYRAAITAGRKTTGPIHPQSAGTLDHLSWVSRSTGDLAAAEQLARESLNIRLGALGDRHPDTGTSRVHLAAALCLAGKARQALAEADRALSAYRGSLPDSHWKSGLAHIVRGAARVELGDRAGESEALSGYEVVRSAWHSNSTPVRDAARLLAVARRHFSPVGGF